MILNTNVKAKTTTDGTRATPLVVMIVNTKQPTQQRTGRLAWRQRSSSGLHIVNMSRDYITRRHLHTRKASGHKLVGVPYIKQFIKIWN